MVTDIIDSDGQSSSSCTARLTALGVVLLSFEFRVLACRAYGSGLGFRVFFPVMLVSVDALTGFRV